MGLLDTASTLKVDRYDARRALREYHAARGPRTPEDAAIMSAYRAIGRGQAVISVDESIRAAGWNDDGTTKLAIVRADTVTCFAEFTTDSAFYRAEQWRCARSRTYRVSGMPPRPRLPPNELPYRDHKAIVPLIPLPLRPKHDLKNYWILWEASWTRVPVDPLLLRKLSGDLWLVLAAWDLSPVEQAVLARRFNS